jgi:hypothetical protein
MKGQVQLDMNSKLSSTAALMRVMLTKRETYRVPSKYQGLRVRAGLAWITLSGRDLLLKRSEEMTLMPMDDFAVVSALGCTPLVIELLSEVPRAVGFLRGGVRNHRNRLQAKADRKKHSDRDTTPIHKHERRHQE